MRVEALVQRTPITIQSGSSIKSATQLFAKHNIGLLVITSAKDQKKPEGVLSERDVVRAIANGIPLTDSVDSVATKKIITVKRSDSLAKALKLMLDHNIRHLVVENYDETLYGVLSVRDFLRERKILEELLKEESTSAYSTD